MNGEPQDRDATAERCSLQNCDIRGSYYVGCASVTKLVLPHSMVSGEPEVGKSLHSWAVYLVVVASLVRIVAMGGGGWGVSEEALKFGGRGKTEACSTSRIRSTCLLADCVCLLHRDTHKLVPCTMRRACLRGQCTADAFCTRKGPLHSTL
jgi:hypothetical protein